MGIGVSVFLIAVGAVMTFAINVTTSGFNINTIGIILMVVGVLGLLIDLLLFAPRRRRVVTDNPGYATRRTVVERRDDVV
jgi:beta-lactamase regulating signal transducer with metallopeptidase domain